MRLHLKKTYKVDFTDIDFTGKLNLYSLSNYMQKIASDHATELGFNYYKGEDEETAACYWILSRVKYQIESYPEWEEKISLETYPGGYDKLFAVRCFKVYNEKGELAGSIIGDYILMDAKKQRPVKIKGIKPPLNILDFPYEGGKLDKLAIPTEILKRDIRKCRYSEIDLNQHMNNGQYIKWILDMLSLEQIKTHSVASLQINFNASVMYGDIVKVYLGKNEAGKIMVWGMSEDEKTNYFISEMSFKNPEQAHLVK